MNFSEFFKNSSRGEESLKWNIKNRKEKGRKRKKKRSLDNISPVETIRVTRFERRGEGLQQIPPRLARVPEGVVPSARMIHPYKFRNAFILSSILLVPVRIFTTRPSHDPFLKGNM